MRTLTKSAGGSLSQQWNCVRQPLASLWRGVDLIDALLLFSLLSFAYVYFFPFSEGTSRAPALFFFLKYLVWGAVLAWIVVKNPGCPVNLRGLPGAICAFALLVIAIHLLHLPQYADPRDIVHLGALVAFIPLVALLRSVHVRRLFDLLPPLMCAQVVLSALALAAGVPLWEDGSFVGLFSNPNSFALALNLAFFRIMAQRRRFTAAEVLQMAVLAGGIVFSKSNSQLLIFFVGIATLVAVTGVRRLRFVIALMLSVPALVVGAFALGLVNPTVILDAFLRASELFSGGGSLSAELASGNATVSMSVSTREEIHLFAWEFLQRASLPEVLFGDFATTRYHLFDSQFLVFVVNYGILTLAAFLALLGVALLQSWIRMRLTGEWFDLLALMTFTVTFLFSRVLYYFPINLLFLAYLVHVGAPDRVVFYQLVRSAPPAGAVAR